MSDLSAEEMCAWANANMERVAELEKELERLTATLRGAYTENKAYAKRIAELEAIVRAYADPTGRSQHDQDIIMSCQEWWKDEQALKGDDDE